MRVLWVATKTPLPAVDGGRVVTVRTLEALSARGVGGVVIAPGVDGPMDHRIGRWELRIVPPAHPWQRLAGWWHTGSTVVARHWQPAVRQEVERVLAAEHFDVVHAEQLHALPQCEPATRRGRRLVLRAQNVEHALVAAHRRPWLPAAVVAAEVRRVAAYEAAAVRAVDAAVALSADDAAALSQLAGRPVAHVAAPFPVELPPGPPLAGSPAVVVFGSEGWFVNYDGLTWLQERVWPAVRARYPGALLHVMGLPARTDAARGIVAYPPPAASVLAFPRNAMLVVPSRVWGGVRMKVLEAWARGVPVIATTAVASGLEDVAGEAIARADDAVALTEAIGRLHDEPEHAAALCRGGRALLQRRHDPGTVAERLLALYAGTDAGLPAAARRPETAVPARPIGISA